MYDIAIYSYSDWYLNYRYSYWLASLTERIKLIIKFECQIVGTCIYTKLYYLQPVYVTL